MDAFVKRTKVGSARQQPARHAAAKDAPKSPGRPAKRIKVAEVADSEDDNDDKELGGLYDSRESSPTRRPQSRGRLPIDDLSRDVSPDDTDMDDRSHRPTAIESSLPAIISDEEAIAQYESFKASQGEAGADKPDSAASRLDSRKWIRGKSSLYVDAFNLALDTVLDEESHLFDARESAVFEKWRALPYESQFLYVRLFLRKNAQWHRMSKLGYHSDIQDVEAAVLDLQQARDLPGVDETETVGDSSSSAAYIDEEITLAEQFVFADTSAECITTVPEAVSLLSLDETKAFAKEAKVRGKNKGDIAKSICRTSRQQSGLFSVGLRRSSTMDSATSFDSPTPETGSPVPEDDTNRNKHFLEKILAIAGPCIRLSLPVFKLFERVHLVFYRSTEWTDKSLTAIILAKISRRNFPVYVVSRSANIFASRAQLLEFETSMRTEFAIDNILEFNGPVREADFQRVIGIFEKIYPRWQTLLVEEQLKEDRVYESGEGAYLRRLNPGHSYTRIVHKAAHTFGRLKDHKREHELLSQLLEQRLFHLSRRGAWYQRKALLEEHYMFALEEDPAITNVELQKKHWKRISVATCEIALEDRDCHLIYHYDIQKRIVKLEKQLKVPKRLQHDFGHVRLKQPEQHHVHGTQLKKDDITGKRGRGPSTKTIWIDKAEGGGECSVEALCLSDYRSQGWKGYHAEGGIVRTLFAYLFFDILFIYIPNVFQTAYQTCPLDLHTDAFYATRCSEVNHRLVEIANGQGAEIIRAIDERERERRTCVVGLNWDYELEDLVELAGCFNGAALATICKVMAQEYGQRGGGIPDLILWRSEPSKEVMFSEVKSANDRLSDTQRLWIHVLTGAGIRVALCNAVAGEVREV